MVFPRLSKLTLDHSVRSHFYLNNYYEVLFVLIDSFHIARLSLLSLICAYKSHSSYKGAYNMENEYISFELI